MNLFTFKTSVNESHSNEAALYWILLLVVDVASSANKCALYVSRCCIKMQHSITVIS